MATGNGTGGWKLLALPFMGSVNVRDMVALSVVNPDTAQYPIPLIDRLWTLTSNAFVKLQSTDILKSVQGYGEGFLVYLYPGDTLNMPLTRETAYLPAAKAAKSRTLAGDWQLTLTVNDERGILDNFSVFGVEKAGESELPDLMMPDAGVRAGFKTARGLMALAKQKNDGAGKIWTFSVANECGEFKNFQLALSDMTAVPLNLLVYLDNPHSFSTDLRATGGNFSFENEARETREFKIVVGDSAFVKRNTSLSAPARFALEANFPNPFNPITTIRFEVPDFTRGQNLGRTRLLLNVFNIRGQQVAALCDGPARIGRHQVMWNGRDGQGRALASGIYLYRITVMDARGVVRFTDTRKMVLLK